MTDLKYWQNKIREKRKETPWDDFVMELGSWKTLMFHKTNNHISIYPMSERIWEIISIEDFEASRDNLPYIDISDNFFDDFEKLFKKISLPWRLQFSALENSHFSSTAKNAKNNYLSYNISNTEDVGYSISVKSNSKYVFNSTMVVDWCDSVYNSHAVFNGFKIFYSKYIHNSNNIWLSTNLMNCSECIFCDNLENKSYYIANKQYTKEEYKKKKQEILSKKDNFDTWFRKINAKWINFGSKDVTGDGVINSNDVTNGSITYNITDGNNVYMSWEDEDNRYIYDSMFIWSWWWNHYYSSMDLAVCENIYCTILAVHSSNIYYSYFLENCSFCIWCIGLKNKSYCILNKQYTKEEWEILADKIFSQMHSEWILWDFFPGSINPFYFNDTIAWMLWDFTKQEVEEKWYLWRDEEIKVDIPASSDIITIKELGEYQWYENWEWQINPGILQKVIKDENGNYYKIIQMEYDFLVKHSIPLPILHWLDRMKLNLVT